MKRYEWTDVVPGEYVRAEDHDTAIRELVEGLRDGVKLEVDHVHPRSKGGSDSEDNLVTACFDCNQGKKDMILPKGL